MKKIMRILATVTLLVAVTGYAEAQQGGAKHPYTVGSNYYVAKDFERAAAAFLEAARRGHLESLFIYGYMHHIGQGVPKKPAQAVSLYRDAAYRGHDRARLNLALMYAKGEGVPKDYVKAYAWFNLSAALGNKDAAAGREVARQLMTKAREAEAQELSRGIEAEIKRIQNEPRLSGFGSGFIVSEGGRILTNEHVIRGCRRVQVVHGDTPHEAHEAQVRAFSQELDLALVEASSISATPASFRSDSHIRLGEKVLTAGYPAPEELSVSLKVHDGIVSSPRGPTQKVREGPGRFQYTAPTTGGNSGGPVFDEAGNVIGVVVSGLRKGQNVNFAIRSTMARGFLEGQGIAYKERDSGTPLTEEQIAEHARAVTVHIRCWK